MRVWKGSSEEEFESLVIRDRLVSQLDNITRTLFDLLLKKNWLKCWIKIFTDVFKKYPFTKLNGELQRSQEI